MIVATAFATIVSQADGSDTSATQVTALPPSAVIASQAA
jgi:hypothetical protein